MKPTYTPNQPPNAVLIDDDAWVGDVWQLLFDQHGKTLWRFTSFEECSAHLEFIPKNVPFFIDRYLEEDVGDDIANKLANQGFAYLYLSTNSFDPDFDSSVFKGVIAKEPPDWLFK